MLLAVVTPCEVAVEAVKVEVVVIVRTAVIGAKDRGSWLQQQQLQLDAYRLEAWYPRSQLSGGRRVPLRRKKETCWRTLNSNRGKSISNKNLIEDRGKK